MDYKRLVLKRKDEVDEVDEIEVDENRLLDDIEGHPLCKLLSRRLSGDFCGRAMYLWDIYEWVIGRDAQGVLCLVPLKKLENEEEGAQNV